MSFLYQFMSHRNKCQAQQAIALKEAKTLCISAWIMMLSAIYLLALGYIQIPKHNLVTNIIVVLCSLMLDGIAIWLRNMAREMKAYAAERGETAAFFQEMIDEEYAIQARFREMEAEFDVKMMTAAIMGGKSV